MIKCTIDELTQGGEIQKRILSFGRAEECFAQGRTHPAMTATATASLRKSVIKTLGMIDPEVVTKNIDKTNLIYSVLRFESMETTFSNVIQILKSERYFVRVFSS